MQLARKCDNPMGIVHSSATFHVEHIRTNALVHTSTKSTLQETGIWPEHRIIRLLLAAPMGSIQNHTIHCVYTSLPGDMSKKEVLLYLKFNKTAYPKISSTKTKTPQYGRH